MILPLLLLCVSSTSPDEIVVQVLDREGNARRDAVVEFATSHEFNDLTRAIVVDEKGTATFKVGRGSNRGRYYVRAYVEDKKNSKKHISGFVIVYKIRGEWKNPVEIWLPQP